MKNLKPIKVKIFYDENLKKITGKDSEEIIISENLNFAMFLNFIFSFYPEITKRFIPGTLGFLLNGKPPKENDVLKEEPSVYREMNEGLLNLIKDFQNLSKLCPTANEEYYGIEDLYTQIQLQFEGGEDLLKD